MFNRTRSSVTITSWQLCTRGGCVGLPTVSVESFAIVRIRHVDVPGWPMAGLDSTNDMVGLLDAQGQAIDSMNWGTPDPSWSAYTRFHEMLWTPGILIAHSDYNYSFFIRHLGAPYPTVSDWLSTASPPATLTPTATPSSSARHWAGP